MSADGPSPLEGILETSLYHEAGEGPEVERFYSEVLGLALVSSWPGGMAFRAGAGVLLLFDRAALAERDGPIAAHGATGPGHVCMVAGAGAYDAWKQGLAAVGVEVTHEHSWAGGRRSFYFNDPAGNLLEIADGDLWPSESSANES